MSPAQIGAAWDVPPPISTCWSNTIRAPVNGSAAAATSGDSRWVESRFEETLRCQSGRREQRRHPAAAADAQRRVEPGLLSQPSPFPVEGQCGARRRRSSPAATKSRPARRHWAGRRRPVVATFALQSGVVAAGGERRRAMRLRLRQRRPHGREIRCSQQLVARPADRKAPRPRRENCRSASSNICAIFS